MSMLKGVGGGGGLFTCHFYDCRKNKMCCFLCMKFKQATPWHINIWLLSDNWQTTVFCFDVRPRLICSTCKPLFIFLCCYIKWQNSIKLIWYLPKFSRTLHAFPLSSLSGYFFRVLRAWNKQGIQIPMSSPSFNFKTNIRCGTKLQQ